MGQTLYFMCLFRCNFPLRFLYWREGIWFHTSYDVHLCCLIVYSVLPLCLIRYWFYIHILLLLGNLFQFRSSEFICNNPHSHSSVCYWFLFWQFYLETFVSVFIGYSIIYTLMELCNGIEFIDLIRNTYLCCTTTLQEAHEIPQRRKTI